MDILKRLFGLFLVFFVAFAFSACKNRVDTSWIIRYDGTLLPLEIFKYYANESRNKALNILADAGASSQEEAGNGIDGKDFNTWIRDDAINSCKDLIALELLFKSESLTFSEQELNEIKANTDSVLEAISQEAGKISVGYNDVKRAYSECKAMYKKIFNHYYNRGGKNFVTDEDLVSYYRQAYASYSMLTVYPFTFSNDTANEDNSPSTEQLKKAEETTENYVNLINSGEKNISDISSMLEKTAEGEPALPITETVNLSNANIPEKVLSKLRELDTGKAGYVQVDDVFIILYKLDIDANLPDLSRNDVRDDILNCMKQDEFYSILSETKKNLNFEVNLDYSSVLVSEILQKLRD